MKKSKAQFMNAGGASVIVIFVVLCLSMLGALAVSSSYADLRLSNRYRTYIESYYTADAHVQEKLFQLEQLYKEDSFNTSEITKIIPNVQVIKEETKTTLSFEEAIDDKQAIEVTVVRQQNSDSFKVLSYKVIRTQQENYDQTLKLWNGVFEE